MINSAHIEMIYELTTCGQIHRSFLYADKALRASVRFIEELQRNFEMRAEFYYPTAHRHIRKSFSYADKTQRAKFLFMDISAETVL